MIYKPGMNLTEYFENYHYFPKLTDFIFGKLAYAIRCRGFLEKEDFILIWLWKTQLWQIDQERGEFKTQGGYFAPDEQEIVTKTKRIFETDHLNIDDVAKLIGHLYSLRGVGYKVASAILSVVFPDLYGIVDRHVEKTLGMSVTDTIEQDCAKIIFRLRKIAMEQTRINKRYWTPRMVDMALWVLNR